MRKTLSVSSALSLALMASGILGAQAAESPYYDPSNAASSTGYTTGYELFRTIGCPGKGLLETPCKVPPAPKAEPAPAPAPTPAPAPAPAPKDSDGDGVVDAQDKCPGTPLGRKVDAVGCELDSDGDGVVDGIDKCPDTPKGDRVDEAGCTLLKTIILKGVNFDNDSAALRDDARRTLDEAVATLKRYPTMKVEIAGHTDSRGKDAYNQQLSERRAKSVVDYFVSHGIPAENLSAKGYGEMQPIADNVSDEGRHQNRRVELRVLD